MLSYQHAYHAGNFADVIKHLTLSQILHYLTLKETPLFYLETHAGRGSYALNQKFSNRTQEYLYGIQPVWDVRLQLPASAHAYRQCLEQLNPEGKLLIYPGSPQLATLMLRPQDRLYLCELHPQEFDALTRLSKHHRRVHFANEDGFQALKSLLPPPEKRGVIFIDPSFEIKSEYTTVPKRIQEAYSRFPQGTYVLWYPMTASVAYAQLNRKMLGKQDKKMLHLEWTCSSTPLAQGMTGTGLWIINPPYTLAQTLTETLHALKKPLNGRFKITVYDPIG